MAAHFISVLGTSNYVPIIYKDEHFTGKKEQFIQISLIEKYEKILSSENAKITIFVTDKSEEKNGEALAEHFRTLKQTYKNLPELVYQRIPEGKDETEIWGIFDKIYNQLSEGDDIIFDITHSFRSIPMLALVIVNYARTMKACSLLNMSYGSYEAKTQEEKTGEYCAPIIDLTAYYSILDWTNAANAFRDYGRTDKLNELFEKYNEARKASQSDQSELKTSQADQRVLKKLEWLVDGVNNLSDSLLTGRGADGSSRNIKRKKDTQSISIKTAYDYIKNTATADTLDMSIKPMYSLMVKAIDDYSIFDQKENYLVGLAATKWYIKHNMIQQGFTSLEETIITYLCNKMGIDELDRNCREGAVGNLLKELEQVVKKYNNSNMGKEEAAERFDNDMSDCLDKLIGEIKEYAGQKNIDSNILEKACCYDEFDEDLQYYYYLYRICQEKENLPGYKCITYELVSIVQQVKQFRNDINHFGMNSNPNTKDKFYERLIYLYKETLTWMESEVCEGKELDVKLHWED